MRTYDYNLVEILQRNTKLINNNGIDIILKLIPDENRAGYLDPRELNIMKANGVEVENIWAVNEQNFEVQLPKMRDFMGFPNRNLNTIEIYTKYEEITESGNKVGLWRYYPRKSQNHTKRPALIFIHGGGFIGGTVYTVENFCRLIAELADAVVFNVDYSLAPEKPYPNGFNDNYYAVKHVYEHAEEYGIDPGKIAVGGDSAGGNFTAAVCLKAREEKIPQIAMQVLIYPGVVMGNAGVEGYEWSERYFEMSDEQRNLIKKCLLLGRPEDITKNPSILSYVLEEKNIYNPYVSPMLAKSHANLPKAVLVSAEFDGLRIQTEFYAKQLSDAGVPVTLYRYKGMTHAFIDKLGVFPQAEDLCIEIAKAIKDI